MHLRHHLWQRETKMDRFAATHHENLARNISSLPCVGGKASPAEAPKFLSSGLKPAIPTTLVTQLKKVVQQVMQYLGVVKLCDNSDSPPKLKTLKTAAYILALPTSKQLCLITSSGSDSVGHLHAYKPITQTLDRYNQNLKKLNELAHSTKNLEKTQKKLKVKIDDARLRLGSASPELENKLNQLCIKIQLGNQKLASLQSALRNDLELLDVQLVKAIETPGSGHVGILTALHNGLRDVETLRGLRTDWRYWEMLGVSPAEYDDVAANPTPIQAWLDLRFSAKEALSFRNAGFNDPTKVTYLKGTGVTGPIAKQMHAAGYTREFFSQEVDDKGHQVSAASYGFTLGMHHDAWAENDAIQIGSGSFNAPMGGYYRDTSAGPTSLQVFKKDRYVTLYATDPTDDSPIPLQPGQAFPNPYDNGLAVFQNNKLVSVEDQRTPRIGLRNVLASQLAQALGLTVIVQSEFSARSVPLTREEIDSISHGVQPVETFSFGISMQGVEGVYGFVNGVDVLPTDLTIRTTMIEQLIDLQLFDAVAGQGDRHVGNIMVDKDGRVFGIDNDQCFPDLNADDPEVLAIDYDRLESGTRGALLPRIITKEQRQKWLAMDEKTVIKALRMATEKQRDAAVARFRKVQAHIRGLADDQVVDRSALTNDTVTKVFQGRAQFATPLGRTGTADASYFGRYLG
jgi:hypothetical protein